MKSGKILITLLVAAAANSLAWICLPCSRFSPDGSKVAFLSSVRPYGYEIYTVNADGTDKVRFKLKGDLWGGPYFSPDGSKIAFINDDWSFVNGNIFLVDVDGTNLTQVTAYGNDPFKESWDPAERTGVLNVGLTFSPDGRKILYCSAEFGTSDIFAINVDGTGKTRLTSFAEYDESGPVFLPDGDKILFTVKDKDSLSSEEGEIWIMNADGSAKKRLLGPFCYELAGISPDGKRIAYGERHGYERATYVAALDGSSRFKIADDEPEDLNLSFSPDGTKVLFILEGCAYVVNADGTGVKNLTPGWVWLSDPAFFADGAEVAFVGRRRPGSADNIYTVDVDGSNLKAFRATAGINILDLVAVSPTGDRLLFWGRYYGGLNWDRFVVNADGTGLARLTTWYAEYNPYGGKFSADGSKVAYLSNETGDYHIYTVNADGTGKVKFELEGGLWGEPYLSPDEKKVAFVNYYEFFRKGNIFLADVDGRNLRQLTKYGDAAEITDDPDCGIGVLYDGLTFSPDGRKILYYSAEFGSKDIFAINVDGTGKTRLTDFADCEESGPVFLAGGDKILFTATRDLVNNEIWLMNADGSGKEKVPDLGDAELIAVSPDGKKILVDGQYRGEDPVDLTRGTFVADLNGSKAVEIAGEYENCSDVTFSPDGKKLLFRNERFDEIHIVNADGTGEKNLTREWVGDSFSTPAFFANGAKIVFGVRTICMGPARRFDYVCAMDADGSNRKLFKAAKGTYFSEIVVSPAGDRFLFRVDYGDYDDGGPGDYFVVNADGSGLTQLTKKPYPPRVVEG